MCQKGKHLASKHSGKVRKALTKMTPHWFGTTTFLHLVQRSTSCQETEVQVHREGDSAVAFSMHANRRLAHASINI